MKNTPTQEMNHAANWPVRTYLVWLVLACLLPGVIGAIVFFTYEYRAGRGQLERNMLQTARALMQAVDNHLLKVEAVAQTLATSELLEVDDLARFHRRARNMMALNKLGYSVVLRNRDGQQILNTLVDFGQPLPVSAQPEQVNRVFTTGLPAISNVFVGTVAKRLVVSVDVPVAVNGKVVYVLSLGISPEDFNTLLKAQKLPSDWVAAIVDSAGTIAGRTSSPEQFVGQKATSDWLSAMRKAAEGVIEAETVEGIPVLSFYRRSPVTNWAVGIGIPRHVLVSALIDTLSILAAGVAVLFTVGLMLAWFMGNQIARSVKALTAPAMALGEGRPAPIPQVHVKEAAELANAIGRAAEVLKARAAALQAREAELTEAHRLAKFGTWSWDLRTGAVHTSDSIREIYGRDIPSFPEQRGTLLPVETWEKLNAASKEALQNGKGYDLEIMVNHGAGYPIWINSKCEAVRDEGNEVIALRGTIQDITERKHSEQQIRDAALHDSLTALPNRTFVFEYCSHLLAAARRGHGHGALLFIDLDRFKPVNDLHGHETGDQLLQEVAKRLIECTRHEDLVGRLGGDEFVIVLPFLGGDLHRAAVVAEYVVESINRPFRINSRDISISASIGISFFPNHGTDVGKLIHAADLAMYQAKQGGRANYQFYTPELDRRASHALSIEVRLKNALKNGYLKLNYQPVVDIKSGCVMGAEALVRLEDNHSEALGPESFIPIAESAGLIIELGEWVAAEACRQQKIWANQGLKVNVSVNVSPLQFRQQAFAENLSNIISNSGIDPSNFELEVTESTVMESVGEAVEILNRIKSLGVRVALDDFGTGYSSLSSLSNLPLDKLKIDQSFVRRIERDQASRAVTEAIIALGRSLKLHVVAEGIESESALLYLRHHGCELAQGYWFSQPLAPSEFAAWCKAYRNRDQVEAV